MSKKMELCCVCFFAHLQETNDDSIPSFIQIETVDVDFFSCTYDLQIHIIIQCKYV